MAIWIELHCDVRGRKPRTSDFWQPWCDSDRNESPGMLCRNSLEAVRDAMALVKTDAQATGWKFRRGTGWMCPHCQHPETIK